MFTFFFEERDSKNTTAQIIQWSITMSHSFIHIFYKMTYPLFVGIFNPCLVKDKTTPQKATQVTGSGLRS